MKKVIAFIGIAAMAVSLAACGNQTSQSASSASGSSSASSSSSSSSSEAEAKVVGGWTMPESMTGSMSNEAAEAFSKAQESNKGEMLNAIYQLGSQVVAGTNYMMLCTDGARTEWKVATVYEDLSGNAEITNVADFDLGKYAQDKSGEAGEQGLAGGWTVYKDPSGQGTELPEEVAAAFSEAMTGLTGADYLPCLYMGSQVVNGSNYAILCEQTLVTKDPVTNLALVYIYAPATGDPEIMNIYPLDLTDYTK